MRYLAPLIVFTSSMVFAQDKISDFKWKSRLLVVSGATEETLGLLGAEKAGLEECDLKVFILSGSGLREHAAKPALVMEFQNRLSPQEGEATLIWPLAEFGMEKLFASIDAMPMRKREMRQAE